MLNLYKKRGETPLERITRFRVERSEFAHETLSYAGRLDPLAEGVLPVLVGEDENKNRKNFLNSDKEYEVSVVLGVSTDTGDVLGLVQNVVRVRDDIVDLIKDSLPRFTGKFVQEYPKYSSVSISRRKRSSDHPVASKEVEVYTIEFLGQEQYSAEKLLEFVFESIGLVMGDFRQEQIRKAWQQALMGKEGLLFPAFNIKVSCSGGAYMRLLASRIAAAQGVPALAVGIKRTKAGAMDIQESIW